YGKPMRLFRTSFYGRTARGNRGKRTVMKGCAFRIGLSAFAFWFCTLPTAPAEEIRIAQALPNPAPPRVLPRAPATGQVTPAPAENSRAQSAPQTTAGQAPAHPQVPTRTEILNFENWAVTCNEFADGPKTRRCSALLQILQQNTNQIVFT